MQHRWIMEIEITQEKVIYEGKEYGTENIKVVISIKNRSKGNIRLMFLVIVYIIIFATIFSTSVSNIVFPTYFFPLFSIYTISFLWLFYVVSSRYYWEFATIQLGSDKKLRLLYSRDRRVLVDRIIEIAGSVVYTTS